MVTRNRTLVILILLISIVLLASWMVTTISAFDSASLVIDETVGETTLHFTLTPGAVLMPSTPVELQWTLLNIAGVHLNGVGQIGEYSITDSADLCSSFVFDVQLPDESTLTYTIQPDVLFFNPVLWLGTAGIVVLLIGIAWVRRPEGLLFHPRQLWASERRWSILLRVVLLVSVILLPFYALVPVCQSTTILTYLNHYTLPTLLYLIWWVMSISLLVMSLFRPDAIANRIQDTLERLPMPIVLTGTLVFWWQLLVLAVIWRSGAHPLPIVGIPLIVWIVFVGGVCLTVSLSSERRASLTPYIERLNTRIDNQRTQYVITFLILVVWIVLWQWDWQVYIVDTWARTLIASLLFVGVGMWIHRAILPKHTISLTHNLTIGFGIGLAVNGLLGVWARSTGQGIHFVVDGLWITGAIALVVFILRGGHITIPTPELHIRRQHLLLIFAGVILFMVVSRLAYSTFYYTPLGSDIYTYTAYTTHFAYSDTYSYSNVLLNTTTPPNIRLQMLLWPLAQGVVSQTADVHPLVAQGMLRCFLLILAYIGVYELARVLKFSRSQAVLVLMAQTLLLLVMQGQPDLNIRQPGFAFFWRISEDKFVASYILTPIVLRVFIDYLNIRQFRFLLILALASLGFIFTHLTIPILAGLLLGFIALQDVLFNRRLRPVLVALIVYGVGLLIPLLMALDVRLVTDMDAAVVYVEEVQTLQTLPGIYEIEGTPFFAVNTAQINYPAFWIVFIGGAAALFYIRQRYSARYVLAAALLQFMIVFPYTGWLLAKVVTVSHISRGLWLMPFGISAVFLFDVVLNVIYTRWQIEKSRSIVYTVSGVLLCAGILITLPSWIALERDLGQQHQTEPGQSEQLYSNLATIGRAIDDHSSSLTTVLADPFLMNFVPALSPYSRTTIWRTPDFTAGQGGTQTIEAETRFADYERFMSAESDDSERWTFINTNQIDWILTTDSDPILMRFINNNIESFTLVAEAGNLRLFHINGSS